MDRGWDLGSPALHRHHSGNRGQEERIPETASDVGTNIGLRSFSLLSLRFFSEFVCSFMDFPRFCCDFEILGGQFDIL